MKKMNYGTIMLMIIGLLMCIGCSQVSFNNPFGERDRITTNADTTDMSDMSDDIKDVSSDDQADKSKPIEHKIHYLNLKNADNSLNPTSFKESEIVMLRKVSISDFTFDGWYEVTNNIADVSIDGWNAGDRTNDVTLWAKWTANETEPTDPTDSITPNAKVYTIRFDKNTGTGTMDDITADVGAIITLPTCTIVPPVGKKFSCWNGKADGTDWIIYNDGASVKNLSEEDGTIVTLYAQWIDKDAHRIIYQNTKNADNSSNVTSFKESEPVVLTNLSISGWTFSGWYDSSADGTIVTGWAVGEQTSDVTLWAKWTPAEVNYTVKRYFQNISGDGYEQNLFGYADLTKQGLTESITDVTADEVAGFTPCTIVQQKISADCSTEVSVYYDRNIIVYTFNANGGKWDDDTNVKKIVGLFGTSVETPDAPAKARYTADWDKPLPIVFGDIPETWTAQWTANTYTVVFNANGGIGTMANQSIEYDSTTTLSANGFTKEHWAFDKWNTSPLGIGTDYIDEANVHNLTNSETITLYAQWNMCINEVAYSKTAMVQVLSSSTDITCDQKSGAFLSTRGSVTLNKYAIGKYPVTQELYNAVMGNNPSYFTENRAALKDGETSALLRPVEQVSWYDAITFCNKLSLLMGKTRCYKLYNGTYPENFGTIPTGNDNNWNRAVCDWTADGYRLPTECEWECAARGGTYSAGTPWFYTYSGSHTLDDVAWFRDNANGHTWEVGLKLPNSIGLYDMSGNVYEMCWDHSGSINSNTPVTGPASGSDNRRRFKSFSFVFDYEISQQGSNIPYHKVQSDGFRIACSGE